MNRTVKEVRSSTPRRVLAAGGLGLGLLLAAGTPALAQSASDTNYGSAGPTTTVAPTTSTTVAPTTSTTVATGATTTTTAAPGATTTTTVRTEVAGATQTQPPTTSATQVRGATQTRGATLPVTGGDAVGLSVLGAGLVAAGALAVKSSRRRSAAEA